MSPVPTHRKRVPSALTSPDSNSGGLPDCLVYRLLLYFLIIKA